MYAELTRFQNDDQNGHGSHVAGTIGGATFGVAKKVNLVAVKVLGADGSGANSGVLNGMQFVIDDVQKRGIAGKAVMNMSLGGSLSRAVNRAIQALNTAGVVPVVAAGNENVRLPISNSNDPSNKNAHQNSKTLPTPHPARLPRPSPSAPSTPATTPRQASPTLDRQSTSLLLVSRFLALASSPTLTPTSSAVPAWVSASASTCSIHPRTQSILMKTTALACPHVTGLAAYLMSLQGANSADQVDALIKNLATQTGASVKNNAQGTTNLIANNGNL